MFGLYATTGRAASFLAPALFAPSQVCSQTASVSWGSSGAAGRRIVAGPGEVTTKTTGRGLRIACISGQRAWSGGTYSLGRELNHSGVGNVRKI